MAEQNTDKEIDLAQAAAEKLFDFSYQPRVWPSLIGALAFGLLVAAINGIQFANTNLWQELVSGTLTPHIILGLGLALLTFSFLMYLEHDFRELGYSAGTQTPNAAFIYLTAILCTILISHLDMFSGELAKSLNWAALDCIKPIYSLLVVMICWLALWALQSQIVKAYCAIDPLHKNCADAHKARLASMHRPLILGAFSVAMIILWLYYAQDCTANSPGESKSVQASPQTWSYEGLLRLSSVVLYGIYLLDTLTFYRKLRRDQVSRG